MLTAVTTHLFKPDVFLWLQGLKIPVGSQWIQKLTTVKYKKAQFSDDQVRANINQEAQHCEVPVWLWSSGYTNCLDQTNSATVSGYSSLFRKWCWWNYHINILQEYKGRARKERRNGKLDADFSVMVSESIASFPEPVLYLDGLKSLWLCKE